MLEREPSHSATQEAYCRDWGKGSTNCERGLLSGFVAFSVPMRTGPAPSEKQGIASKLCTSQGWAKLSPNPKPLSFGNDLTQGGKSFPAFKSHSCEEAAGVPCTSRGAGYRPSPDLSLAKAGRPVPQGLLWSSLSPAPVGQSYRIGEGSGA